MTFLKPCWRASLTSTNTVLAERLRQGEQLPDGYVLAAREQTAGRGRHDRSWVSEPGRDLTFSFVCRPRHGMPQLLSLPMAMALGLVDALARYDVEAQTKWPNDVLVNRRKIAGILSETVVGRGVIVGIGLNVNMDTKAASRIDKAVTSLALETGDNHTVEAVLDALLPHLAVWLERWESGGFEELRGAWIRHCFNMGQEVRVGDGDQSRTGTVHGFGEVGQMLVRSATGEIDEVWAGDVAL